MGTLLAGSCMGPSCRPVCSSSRGPVLGEQHLRPLPELRLWRWPLFVVGPGGSELLHGSLSTLALVSSSSACCGRLPGQTCSPVSSG